MNYGIVACSQETLEAASLPPLVAPQRALFDFINNTYQWDTESFPASQAIGSTELLGANGLQITGNESFGAEIIYAAAQTFLAGCQFTAVFELEILEAYSLQTIISIIDDGGTLGSYFIFLEFYYNNFDVQDQNNSGSRLCQDANAVALGVTKVAMTRVDAKLSISVAGHTVVNATPSRTMPVPGTPMTEFYLGGYSNSVNNAINIRSMKIYNAVSDSDLPALSA